MTESQIAETDAAIMSLGVAIGDALINSNLLKPEALLEKLAVARVVLESEKYVAAAGIVGTIHAALSDPNAVAQRKHLAANLTSPAHGGLQ